MAWLRTLRCRRGAAMVEYALLAGLVVIVAIASIRTFGTQVNTRFTTITTTV